MATWLNFHLVQEVLTGEPPEVQDAVLDALAILDLVTPIDADTTVLPAWVPGGISRFVLWLPSEFFLTFSYFEIGPVPHVGPSVVVRHFGRFEGLAQGAE